MAKTTKQTKRRRRPVRLERRVRWVPVSEAVPEHPYFVLVYELVCEQVDVARYDDNKWLWEDGSAAKQVTHWAEFPEPPNAVLTGAGPDAKP